MSPMKVCVRDKDELEFLLSVSVGKSRGVVWPTHNLNLYFDSGVNTGKQLRVAQYTATSIHRHYVVAELVEDSIIMVGECATLAGCQALALSHYIKQNDLQVVEEEE